MNRISFSDDDEYENLLQQLKKTTVSEKYRYSTGSLSDFIVDSTNNSSFNNESKQPSIKSPEVANICVKTLNTIESLDNDIVCNKANRESYSSTTKAKNVDIFFQNKTNNRSKLKMKSVVTPRHQIIFTSNSSDDHDDNVFVSSKKRKPLYSLQMRQSLSFSDSDKENNFTSLNLKSQILNFDSETEVQTSSAIPNRHPITNKKPFNDIKNSTKYKTQLTNRINSLFVSDSESEDDFSTLTDRVSLSLRLRKDKNVRTRTNIANESLSVTPKINKISKPFHTEKIVRTKKKLCSIENCFLEALSLSLTENTGIVFKKRKVELANRLFKLFNSSIFDNLLPESMTVSWSKRLTKTAGFTKCRKFMKTTCNDNGELLSSCQYEAAITLSEKIIDNASRLRDTLIHELCHAAVWVLNNVNESHGPYWRSWAAKCKRVHPELPVIERCHNYEIDYKYKYQCTRCSNTIGRHSKSIDVAKSVCARCQGTLELVNKTRAGNPFSNFVKANYKVTKTSLECRSGSVSHREVMKSLSDQFKGASISTPKTNEFTENL